jgi:hypothetical protein
MNNDLELLAALGIVAMSLSLIGIIAYCMAWIESEENRKISI